MAVILNTKGTTESEFRLGKAGATIKTGYGVPGNLAGNLGDLFLDQINGDLYLKRSAGWVQVITAGTNNSDALTNLDNTLIVKRELITATTSNATSTYLARPDYPNIPGQTQHLELPDNASIAFDVDVVGRQAGGLVMGYYNFRGILKTSNNVGTFVQTQTGANFVETTINEGNTAWAIEVRAGDSNGSATIRVLVTGIASTIIQWVANVKQTINVFE